MPLYIDTTDDVLAIAGSPSFEGGQASGITPSSIGNNQASELFNMTISPSGNLQTRQGIETVSTNVSSGSAIQGMHYFDTPNIEEIIVACNGIIFKSTSATSFATTAGTVTSGAVPVNFSQFNNRLYYTDGASNLHFTDGTTVFRQGTTLGSVSVTNPGTGYTSAPAVTVSAPQMAYGTTASAVASYASSQGGIVTGVTVTNGGSGYTSAPTITIAPPSSGTAATANGVLSTSSAPSGLRLIRQFTNRLFAVGTGTDRNTLYASDLLDPEVWKTTNSIVVGGDDGQDIVAIQPFFDYELLVFKPSKIYLVTVDPTASTAAGWTVRLINDRIGCIAGRSVSFAGKDVYFLAEDGIRSVQRSLSDDYFIVGVPISEAIKDVIARINKNFYSKCFGQFHNNRYYLSVPLDSATTNSHTIVYNLLFNAFEGFWNIGASAMYQTNFSTGYTVTGPKLAIGTPTGKLGHSFDYLDPDTEADGDTQFKDFGTTGTYSSYLVTKAYDFDDRIAQKYGSHYEIEFYFSSSTGATISMKRESDSQFVTLGTNVNTATPGGLTLPFTLPATLSAQTTNMRADSLRSYQKWRNMRIKVESPSKKLAVRSVILAANPDTIQVQKNI
jgi:hypothetical protein